MKSQRFSMPRLPFRSSKRSTEDLASDSEDDQPSQEEQLASLAKAEDTDSDGEDCELHIYEKRFDTRGEEVVLRAGTKSELNSFKRRSPRACLILTRHYRQYSPREVASTELEIQSRHIIRALRSVIGTYHGIDFSSRIVTLMEPPMCLFYYRDELRQHAEASNNQQLKDHMRLCLQYTEKTLHQEIKIFDSFKSGLSLAPELEHRHLWMVFKPGCLVYEKIDGIERLSRLRSIEKIDGIERLLRFRPIGEVQDDSSSWGLRTERVCCVGREFGLTHHFIKIKRFDGRRPVHELSAVPLQFHPEKKRIREILLKRGRRFISLFGRNYCFYDGAARICQAFVPHYKDLAHTHTSSRIILDPEQYDRSVTGAPRPEFVLGADVCTSSDEANQKLSDDDVLTCYHSLPGFSLESRKWGWFSVPDIQEIAYDDEAFAGLVLPEEKKRLISALVRHQSLLGGDEYDDLIQGKGKGLIFLLHGPPGVGKTYTAESIADHTRRPLLKITSGELCLPGPWIEERLSNLFYLATRWDGIILLDEADVFMQERSADSLNRNWLVSTLLRVLEYYQGILFLTTNRAETIDSAFKSRIHLSIAYPPLSADGRRQLWKSAIARANRGQPPDWLTSDILDHLVSTATNGREIRNLVRTGISLAQSEERDLRYLDLVQALETLQQFESDFSKWLGKQKIENPVTEEAKSTG
ncbi:hypothetical protein DL770_010583 [Monosporascus sp. CRB-9-2]|nr:hypothetical protein DL770_010583 [Monosporascus sp. CRB-9-2]